MRCFLCLGQQSSPVGVHELDFILRFIESGHTASTTVASLIDLRHLTWHTLITATELAHKGRNVSNTDTADPIAHVHVVRAMFCGRNALAISRIVWFEGHFCDLKWFIILIDLWNM